MKKVPVSTIVPFGLRLQPELKAALEASASQNGRSLNAEIASRLEDSLHSRASLDSVDAIAKKAFKTIGELSDRLTALEEAASAAKSASALDVEFREASKKKSTSK